ncbi:ABC transporter permease [Paenibacillus lignilyticus]|uniref:ABC-2 family transporter protein n=1 Tax=Paenibacillus lignilyticus TaxID=1172615 RepID=A0ABS5CDW5_9BACL|nr:ABC-2 family transporter protein [Paenibacillus lignilyticus]MBP3963942.1 ABC-2 family transporter protein [Paenibacillus lignilyticus]
MRFLKLYARFIPIYFKSKSEHGIMFYLDFLGFAMGHIVNFLIIWVMLDRFNTINGWGMYEVMLIYTMNMFTFGLASIFFSFQMWEVEDMVAQGTFDVMLVKPVNPFIHMIIRTFGHFYLGDVIIGIIMFIVCFNHLNVHMGFTELLILTVVLIGATLVQAAFIVITGSMCFWFTRSGALMDMVVHGIRSFMDYPISIYSKFIRILVTFVVPYAFVNFYPSQLILNKKGETLFSPVLPYIAPVVGLAMFILAYMVWNRGLNKYQGTGS